MQKTVKEITLTEDAAFLFNEVAYSLHSEQSEDGLASDEEVVNHILEEVNQFERRMGYSITEWLSSTPTERQTAEVLLNEFKEWYNSEFDDYLPVSDDKLQKFLTSKYGKG